jgi:putative NADH-flavin reductase
MIANMKIAVFGATGAIGKLLVRQALDNGYTVKAYIRNLSKLDLKHPNLVSVQGELNDYRKIRQAVSGVDAVVSTLGPPLKRKYDDFSVLEGHQNIIRAMKVENVKRFITIGTPSIKSAQDKTSLATKMPTMMAKLFFPSAFKEIVQIGDIIKASPLDWTIIRFIAPNNKSLTGKIKITFGDTKIRWGISRADIADFILKQTTDNQYVRSMPIIGS